MHEKVLLAAATLCQPALQYRQLRLFKLSKIPQPWTCTGSNNRQWATEPRGITGRGHPGSALRAASMGLRKARLRPLAATPPSSATNSEAHASASVFPPSPFLPAQTERGPGQGLTWHVTHFPVSWSTARFLWERQSVQRCGLPLQAAQPFSHCGAGVSQGTAGTALAVDE